jgi:uncharacterized protein
MLGTLNDNQIGDALNAQVIGRFGCHAKGITYVVSVTYTHDAENIYAHSAAKGMKI